MTDFICVYFGGGQSDKWWSITARGFATAKQAEKHGLFMMPTAGVFGFVVIAEGDNWWQVRDDLSILPPNASVSLDHLGRFDVQPAPRLVMV